MTTQELASQGTTSRIAPSSRLKALEHRRKEIDALSPPPSLPPPQAKGISY